MSNANYGYGVTQDTQDLSAGGTVIQPGINENVVFAKAELGHMTDDTSRDKLLMLYFQQGDLELREVIWPVNPDREKSMAEGNPRQSALTLPEIGLTKGDIITPDQQVHLAFRDFNRKIKHVLNAFLKDENASQTGNVGSYEELATVFVNKLQPFFGSKVRLKVVLNKSDYSELPRYGAFIEHDVPKEESKLKIGDRDKVERSQPTTEAAASAATPAPAAAPPPKTASAPGAPAPAAPAPTQA